MPPFSDTPFRVMPAPTPVMVARLLTFRFVSVAPLPVALVKLESVAVPLPFNVTPFPSVTAPPVVTVP